jgi:hypothetical protein
MGESSGGKTALILAELVLKINLIYASLAAPPESSPDRA